MIIIGIDPGQKGGVCVLTKGYTAAVHVDLWVMPSFSVLAMKLGDILRGNFTHVFLEKAQSFPRQGIASAFNYGVHFGELLGFVQTLATPHTLVHPRAWTKAMHLGTKDAEPKKRSLEAAQRLFPNIKLTATDRSKKAHDGLVDALLIAEYGRRTLQGKTHV